MKSRADEADYREALSQVGTARWQQAIVDAQEMPEAVLNGYSCAVGAALDANSTPALLTLVRRVYKDMGPSVQAAKSFYDRPRPFVKDDPAAPLCQHTPAEQRASAARAYPSGHAASGWLVGYILASAAPERTGHILSRAEDYGRSRIVCRVHSPTDVEAGQRLAAALAARLHSSDAFRSDLEKAREEIRVGQKRFNRACPASSPRSNADG